MEKEKERDKKRMKQDGNYTKNRQPATKQMPTDQAVMLLTLEQLHSEPSLGAAPTPVAWCRLFYCCDFAYFVIWLRFCIQYGCGDDGIAEVLPTLLSSETARSAQVMYHAAMLLVLHWGHSKPNVVAASDIDWMAPSAVLLRPV